MKNINDCLFIFWWLKSDIKIINEIGPNDREPIIKYLEEDLYVLQNLHHRSKYHRVSYEKN